MFKGPWENEVQEEMEQEHWLEIRWTQGIRCSISVSGTISHKVEFGGDYLGLGPRRWING